MTSIINVLAESFQLLMDRPVLFVPKIVSALIGAFWIVGLVEFFFSGQGSLYFYAVTAPFISVSGLFAAVMLAVMVKKEDSGNILKEGFLGALSKWKGIAVSTAFLVLMSFLVFIPVSIGLAYFLLVGSISWLVAGFFLTMALLVIMTFLVYFFPISLVEKESVIRGFRDSAQTSVGNSKEVMALTFFSFVVLILASLASNQEFRALGFASFIIMRVISGIITTYVFVVSPKYYLS